jgi:hypothetical protein
MLGLGTLDVAIGLILVYLMLSLVCSAVNEMIELRLKFRSANLHRGITELLGGSAAEGSTDADEKGGAVDLVAQLYQHPLVFGLFKGKYHPASKELPSYIPARSFALALMDLVSKGTPDSFSGARGATAPGASANVAVDQFLAFRSALAEPANQHLQKALLPLVDAAGANMSRVRENIEEWFNGSMDRVSGWYKRRTQKILLLLGIAVTIFINADTIAIVNSLSQDEALRNSLVAVAGEYAKTQPSPAPGQADRVTETMDKIKSLGLPVGWDRSDPRKYPSNGAGWLLKVLGWFLTGMAITLGAPFWFDLLNKFMVIRSTVKPHEKSREEGSEDRQLAEKPAATQPSPGTTATTLIMGGSAGEASGAAPAVPFRPHEWVDGDPQEGIA